MPPYWAVRHELSAVNKMRRSFYVALRDQMDDFAIRFALINSYKNFEDAGHPYPFVEKRELKPRARIPQTEYDAQNTFLILYLEDSIPSVHKKYMRFFENNKVTKKNLLHLKSLPFSLSIDRNLKYIEDARFSELLETLLPVDYSLLIQRDPATKARNRYCLTHFHVRVDWPIADAAEDLGRHLRYISKDLYERGEEYAEDLQKKFFEYYGVPFMAGGRRTAAIVAAQFLRRLPCISTVYVASSETRALVRISEDAVSKATLMKLTPGEMSALADANAIKLATFKKNYLVAREGASGVAIFRANYVRTSHSRPPEDGKIRELNPDVHWLTVDAQHILPRPGVKKFAPIPHNVIYT